MLSMNFESIANINNKHCFVSPTPNDCNIMSCLRKNTEQ